MMPKSNLTKNIFEEDLNVNTVTLHDIINKVKETEKNINKKFEEIIKICSSKENKD